MWEEEMREKKGGRGDKEEYDSIFPKYQVVPSHFTAPNSEIFPHHSQKNTQTSEFPDLPSPVIAALTAVKAACIFTSAK